MVSKQEIEHIAKLSRIDFEAGELEKFKGEFPLILDYMEKLKEVDIENIEPTTHSTSIKNIFREDRAKPSSLGLVGRLIKLGPKIKDKFFKVKSVFK